jgi:hypothetical protein
LLQYSQAPLQARSQQILSAQKPLRHSVPSSHDWPDFFLQAPVASQDLVPEHESESSALVTATQVPPVPVHD